MVNTSEFDVWSPQVRANPHPTYARMRTEAPVYPSPGPVSGNTFWFITRYDDVVAVLKDHERFANDFTRHRPPEEVEKLAPSGDAMTILLRHMLNLDPPDHSRLRTLVHKAFTPRIIEGLQPLIQQTADGLLDGILAEHENSFDLVDSFAFSLPATVIAGLLGVPPGEREQFRRWSKIVLYEVADVDVRNIAAMEMIGYFNDIIDKRRTVAENDLISGLVTAEDIGDTLNHQELLSMIMLLLIAGHETTVNLIGTGMLNLMRHPDSMRQLMADPTLVKGAVEEMLRFDGSAETTFNRFTTEDVEVRGMKIPRGEIVIPVVLAANRDPEVFENPNVFDIKRDPNRHIAFGAGIHYCLGSPLARMETAVAMNTLLARLPDIQLAVADQDLQWVDQGIGFHGLKHLPLAFTRS